MRNKPLSNIKPKIYMPKYQDNSIIRVPRDESTKSEQALYLKIFNEMKNPLHWKLQTKMSIVDSVTEADLIAKALKLFLGGAEIIMIKDGRYLVGSKGYVHYVVY